MLCPQPLTDCNTRDAILQAAWQEFRGHGFDAGRMDRIAAAAGVSKRTVYKHFADKNALFAALLQRLCRADLAQLVYRPDRPLRDQLLALLEQRMRVLHDGSFAGPSAGERGSDQDEGATAWFRAAVADRKLKPVDPVFAAHQLHGLVKGFAFGPQPARAGAPAPATRAQATQAQGVNSAVERFLSCYA